MNKFTALIFSLLIPASVTFAFEDCLLITEGKLSDIRIQHNDVIDVFPLITIMNDKNTLIIHPLKEGKTKFCITKDKKNEFYFNVEVKKDSTIVEEKDGFEVFKIDSPPGHNSFYFELDEPPEIKSSNTNLNNKANKLKDSTLDNNAEELDINYEDMPPELREKN